MKIFNEFWQSGNKPIQETFIHALVDVKKTKNPKDSEIISVRQLSRVFHLKKDGVPLPVYKDMFLNALAISNTRLHTVLKGDKENVGISLAVAKPRNPKPSKGFKWNESDVEHWKEFFGKIPKAPGHYCRKNSSKIYLTTTVKTMVKQHQLYKARCSALNRNSLGITKFT